MRVGAPGIPEGKLVDAVARVTRLGTSHHLTQPHAHSFLCPRSPLRFPNEASLPSAFLFSLHEGALAPAPAIYEALSKVLTCPHPPRTLAFLCVMTLEPLLSVHPRSVLTTITPPNYEDSQSLILTVLSRHRYYVSIFKGEKRKLWGSRPEL